MDDLLDVLLIEDNSTDADLTMRALKKKNNGLKIKHVEDGAEALDFIFSQGVYSNRNPSFLPKLILMDLQLPRINGHEVLKQIKNNERTRKTPIVILTSSSHLQDVMECYSNGANAYMVKPMDFEEYILQVSSAVHFWLEINYLPTY
ncbi:MAG TPA: response regulator [Cytophagales bacterium]|nr:response regulator [Cytophagales bacterium]